MAKVDFWSLKCFLFSTLSIKTPKEFSSSFPARRKGGDSCPVYSRSGDRPDSHWFTYTATVE